MELMKVIDMLHSVFMNNVTPCKYGHAITVFDLITAPALITAPDFLLYFPLLSPTLTTFFLAIYFIFTYYRPLDDLLALVVENKFT